MTINNVIIKCNKCNDILFISRMSMHPCFTKFVDPNIHCAVFDGKICRNNLFCRLHTTDQKKEVDRIYPYTMLLRFLRKRENEKPNLDTKKLEYAMNVVNNLKPVVEYTGDIHVENDYKRFRKIFE
ncbi:hypothetical protein DMUE_3122 [Dictyocoela muelleri]|nr:hypothetical protein DMUE_3122 [Dictyocoela muelleri]